MKENRIYNNLVELDKEAVKMFFNKRASKNIEKDINNSTMLQDNQPEIANKRDIVEKETIEPYFNTNENSKILDIGCGTGRLASIFKEKDMSIYTGIDISEKLILIANKLYEGNKKFSFFSKDPITFFEENTNIFDIEILSGVLNYINDEELIEILTSIEKCTSKEAIIYLRMPISVKNERLTLKEFWSDELEEEYNSIYRTDKEYQFFLNKYLPTYSLILNDFLYKEDKLNNREETKQKVYILKKKGELI